MNQPPPPPLRRRESNFKATAKDVWGTTKRKRPISELQKPSKASHCESGVSPPQQMQYKFVAALFWFFFLPLFSPNSKAEILLPISSLFLREKEGRKEGRYPKSAPFLLLLLHFLPLSLLSTAAAGITHKSRGTQAAAAAAAAVG